MKGFLLIFSLIFANISFSSQCHRSPPNKQKDGPWNRMCYELCNTEKGGISFEGDFLKRICAHISYLSFSQSFLNKKNILIGPYLKPNQREKPTLCYEVCTKGWAGLGILGPYIKKQANQSLSRMEVLILK